MSVTYLYPIYTTQPVVQLVWQSAVSCKQTSNRFDNRMDVCLHNTASCQTRFDNSTERTAVRSNEQLFVQPVVQLVWQLAVYTIQPVVKPFVKRVW